jgi:para-nitrobenzyl esterase
MRSTNRPTQDVKTSKGFVRGFRSRDTFTFRGIPYARAERFKRPTQVEPWDGILNCERFGRICPQAQPLPDTMSEMMKRGASIVWNRISNAPRKLVVDPPKNASETESLNLNVYTNNLKKGSAPVLVWIHGGAFMFGSGSGPIYQSRWGSLFSKRTGCVLVTINYRLGVFGFMKVKDGDSNCGLRDQIAALKWIHEEIENFGGDPSQVTIAGESAGGMSVGALLASPIARPYFKSAIAMSGAADNVMSREDAERISSEFAKFARIDVSSVQNLCKFSVPDVLTAQTRLLMKAKMAMPFQPFVDGDVLTDFPLNCIRRGECSEKNLMVGFNKSEWALFAPRIPIVSSLLGKETRDDILIERLARQFMTHRLGADSNLEDAKSRAHKMITKLRHAAVKDGSQDLSVQFYTELVFAAPAMRLAEAFSRHKPCHVYRFDFSDSILSAAHAVELPLLFGTHNSHIALQLFSGSVWGKDADTVSRDLIRSFGLFVKHGTPGWESYCCDDDKDDGRRNVYIFDRKTRLDSKNVHKGIIIPELTNVLEASKRPFGIRLVSNHVSKL